MRCTISGKGARFGSSGFKVMGRENGQIHRSQPSQPHAQAEDQEDAAAAEEAAGENAFEVTAPAMRSALAAFAQLAVMAAVVATLAYLPLGAMLALILFLSGIPFEVQLTFGGALHAALGLLVWWVVFFAGACGYAAWVFPWGDKAIGWPGTK